MGKEAMVEEESALAILREAEARATEEELSRVTIEFERGEREAEDELKRQLHVGEPQQWASLVLLLLMLCFFSITEFYRRRFLHGLLWLCCNQEGGRHSLMATTAHVSKQHS